MVDLFHALNYNYHETISCMILEKYWEKLSSSLKEELKYHLPCYKHYNVVERGDQIDGPPTSITSCVACDQVCLVCHSRQQ